MINEKHFKIQEGKKEVTFDDLIKEAVNAVRNEIIQSFEFSKSLMERDLIYLKHEGERVGFAYDQAQDGINYLKSLATETFVIEDYKDIKRIKNKADIKLANGLLVKAYADPERYAEGWAVKCADGNQSGTLDIFALKGATVTQNR